MFLFTVLPRVLPTLLPPHTGTGPRGFWGSNGTIWVQKSLWGTGHTVRTQETNDSRGPIGRFYEASTLMWTTWITSSVAKNGRHVYEHPDFQVSVVLIIKLKRRLQGHNSLKFILTVCFLKRGWTWRDEGGCKGGCWMVFGHAQLTALLFKYSVFAANNKSTFFYCQTGSTVNLTISSCFYLIILNQT